MSTSNKWTQANRDEFVVSVNISELGENDLLRPTLDQLGEGDSPEIKQAVLNGDPLWLVQVVSKEAFDKESRIYILESSLTSAEVTAEKFPEGKKLDNFSPFTFETANFERGKLSIETRISTLERGEIPYFLVYEVLHGAEIYENYSLSQKVRDWVEDEGFQWIEREYGENWECVAIMEYCVRNFHSSSMACLAARILLSDFISDGLYDAGYASRQLEVLASGAEAIALNAIATQEKRNIGSGRSSARKKNARLEVLIGEIEKLSPAVGLMSEDRILAAAFESAAKIKTDMPKTPKIQFEYAVELRSSEPYKSRYEAVFLKNA